MKAETCKNCGDSDCKVCKRLKLDIEAAAARIVSAKKLIRDRKDQLDMRRLNGLLNGLRDLKQ